MGTEISDASPGTRAAVATDVLVVTESAARKARQLAERQGQPDAALRVRVTAGGCSGFSYELSFDDDATADDHVITAADGFRVMVDPRSAPILQGSTLDFDERSWAAASRSATPRSRTSARAETPSASEAPHATCRVPVIDVWISQWYGRDVPDSPSTVTIAV